MQVLEIFPTVLATSTYSDFLDYEKLILLKSEYVQSRDYSVTSCTNILDRVPYLKEWIKSQLKLYTDSVMLIEDDLEITQSWCIIHSGVPQKIPFRRHSNSIISGSFYVAAPEGTTGITFCKNSSQFTVDHPLIDWELRENVEVPRWLKSSETLEVCDNKLVLFQSHLSHGVLSDVVAPRCVLAFNTWFKNGVGSIKKLNRLNTILRE